MQTNARHAEFDVLGFAADAKVFRPDIERMGACDCACGIVWLITGGIEQCLDCIADDLGDRPLMREQDFRHPADILVEQRA